MAQCITKQWTTTKPPQMKLVVEGSSASNETTAILAWTLYYIADSAAESVARPYKVIIAGSTVKESTYAINGKVGTYEVASGTVNIERSTAARNIPFSITVDWGLTWSGVYCGTLVAESSISVAAKTSYAVSYNANGGSGAPSDQTKWHGTALTLASTKPTRTGYTFQGWATSAGGSVAYAAGASYTANAAVTLYAVWRANTFTVSYNANGGSGAPSNQTKTYGVALTLSSTKPTRTNYTFLGWGTSASATTVAYAAGASYTANAAITLYAIWQLSYVKPRITGLQVTRCDSAGTPTEDGTYALVSFAWASDKTVSSVKIEWKASSETAWGSPVTVSASGTSGSVSQVVGSGALSADATYDFRVTVADASGSTPLTAVLGGTAYTIDCLAGGKGVAFGKPAEIENAIESVWNLLMNSNRIRNLGTPIANTDAATKNYVDSTAKTEAATAVSKSSIAAYSGGGDSGIDPDTTLEVLCLTSHTNAPQGLGTFYYIFTAFYNAKSTTAARAQLAFPYNKTGSLYHRYYANSAWSAWSEYKPASDFADYIVEQGSVNSSDGIAWVYRKWNSGIAECWGKKNYGSVACTSAWGNMYESAVQSANFPSGLFSETPYHIDASLLYGNGSGFVAQGYQAPTTTGFKFYLVRPSSATFSNTTCGFHVIGRWK